LHDSLHPATILNSFVSSVNFFMESLRFSISKIMQTEKNLTTFLIWKTLVSCTCLAAFQNFQYHWIEVAQWASLSGSWSQHSAFSCESDVSCGLSIYGHWYLTVYSFYS
jgi:hypothetical protein